MKCEVPLTPEQRLFAAEHHDLVYKFLRKKQLSVDEFYDVVIFAYLRLSDGKLMETQTANYFSDIYPIDCAVLSANA